jgi:hypothetical protein
MRCFQHWSVVAARCSAAVAPPPVVDGGEGVDDAVVVRRAGVECCAKLIDGVVAPCVSGKGAINPLPPPMFVGGWEGVDGVGKKGRAELSDGLAAPEVMGQGAINPWQLY